MGTPLTLDAKREELKSDLEKYRSLPEYILDGAGSVIQRLVKPNEAQKRTTFLPPNASSQDEQSFPSFWLNGIVIALITFLIGGVIAALSNRSLNVEELKLTSWSAVTGALALIANKINIRAFLNTFRRSCADKMLRIEDIDDLSKWLRGKFSLLPPLIWGLLLGPILGWILYLNWQANHQAVGFHIGPFITLALSGIQAVWVGYYLIPFYLTFPTLLNRYQFDLYTLDPSSSEVVGRLSRLLSYAFYVTMAFIVQLTFGLAYVDVLTAETPAPAVIFSVLVWAPTIILFIAGQKK